MKKIKIGILGADAFESAKVLAMCFDNITFCAITDTNKYKLEEVAKSAKEEGLYIKTYNNTDDFYSSEFDMVLASKNMYDYVMYKNTYLTDGMCDFDESVCDIFAPYENALYQHCNDDWEKVDETEMSAEENLMYIKHNKNPIFICFFKVLRQKI